MAVKKMVAKKPVTAMKKASPMKQTTKKTKKTNVDSPETNALKARLGAQKDADNESYRQLLLSKDYNETTGKGGYTKPQRDLYMGVSRAGSHSAFGGSVNFRTGEQKITPYPNKYVPATHKNGSSDRIFGKDGKLIASSATQDFGKSDRFGYSDYKNPKYDKQMGHEQFRQSHIRDSVEVQGRKEKQNIWATNANRVAINEGLQTSEIGSKVKAAINKKTSEKAVNTKKTDSAKVVVKKKTSALKQYKKATEKKKSVEINPKDGLRRPTPSKKIEQTPMAKGPSRGSMQASKNPKTGSNTIGGRSLEKNGFNPGTKIDGDMSKSGRKYPSKDEVGTGRDSMRRQSMKDKLSSTKRTPVKMKKC